MGWRLPACPAIRGWRGITDYHRYLSPVAVPLLAALVQGCTAALPSVSARPAPYSPSAPVPHVSYRSTIGPYTSMRPVEPAPWQQQNQQVAPSPKPAK
jgi:hypothetical protein